MTYKDYIIIAAVALALVFFAKSCNQKVSYIDRVEVRETRDTIVDYSVVSIITPVFHIERVVDTVIYTITANDTTLSVPLPISEYYYSDTNYQAWITGYDCRLDSLKYREKNTTITHTIDRTNHNYQKWGLLAGAEVGYNIKSAKISLAPQIGFEIKGNNFLIGYDVLNNEARVAYLYKFYKR